MAAVTQRENVLILTNNDTYEGPGIMCTVLVTAGAGAAAELVIKRSADDVSLGKYKVATGLSQEFATAIRFKEPIKFELTGTGAEAFGYLEIQ